MGDIASLNINGVTYGLKDEVARGGGSSTPVIGYGETGQQYVTNTGALSNANTLTTWLSVEGKGSIYALFASSYMNVSGYYAKTNSITQLYVDGNLLANVAGLSTNTGGFSASGLVCGFKLYSSKTENVNVYYNFNTSTFTSTGGGTIPYEFRSTAEYPSISANIALLSPIIFNNNFIVKGQVYASKTTNSRQFAVGAQYALL